MPEINSPRRKRKGKIEVLVKETKHRYRKPRTYWRIKRPRSNKRIITKQLVTYHIIRDPVGRIMGYKRKKSITTS